MSNHPRAGQVALPEDLVESTPSSAPTTTWHPDPDNPDEQVAFGTSGHRGSSLRTAFNEDHILATTQAICEYRASQGFDGPLFIGRDTHALSEPAWRSALEVLAANGVEVLVDDRDCYTPTPAVSPRDPPGQPREANRRQRTRRRHRRHPVAQPALRRRLQVQPAAWRAGRHRCHVGHRGPGQRAHSRRAEGRQAHALRPGAEPTLGAYDFMGTYVDDLPERRRPRADQGGRRADRRRPARRRLRGSTGARSPSGTASTSPSSTQSSTRSGRS